MSIFNEFLKKEKPVFTGIARGVGGFGFGGGAGGSSGPGLAAATGGTVETPGNGYVYHIFTSATPSPTRKLVNNLSRNVDYLIIGGGGAGGNGPNTGDYQAAGGGGAGAFLTGTSSNLSAATYPVTIGAGGAAGSGSFLNNTGGQGNDGNDTTWNSLTAPGGGGGGGGTNSPPGIPGRAGGSSGANGGYGTAGQNKVETSECDPYPGSGNTFPSPPSGWGGDGHGSYGSCGGGGGGASDVSTRQPPAGEAPAPDAPTSPYTRISGQDGFAAFNGDTGIPPSYGTPGPGPGRYFAAGGGGGHDQTPPGIIPGASGGVGGFGGGGNGGTGGELGAPQPVPVQNARKGSDATAHTGSGGGGCGRDFHPGNYQNGHGGAGADGIVILRYLA